MTASGAGDVAASTTRPDDWGVVDTLGKMQQLGVIPDDAPGSAPRETQSA